MALEEDDVSLDEDDDVAGSTTNSDDDDDDVKEEELDDVMEDEDEEDEVSEEDDDDEEVADEEEDDELVSDDELDELEVTDDDELLDDVSDEELEDVALEEDEVAEELDSSSATAVPTNIRCIGRTTASQSRNNKEHSSVDSSLSHIDMSAIRPSRCLSLASESDIFNSPLNTSAVPDPVSMTHDARTPLKYNSALSAPCTTMQM